MAISRRKFLGISATAATASVLPWKFGAKAAYANTWSPTLSKFTEPLRGLSIAPLNGAHPILGDPNGIPVLLPTPDPVFNGTTYPCWMYNITASEFTDTLHSSMNPTTLWGYSDTNTQVKRHLAGVIVAIRGIASRLRFTNALPSTPHMIPNDKTVPGANLGDNRIAVHLHGGAVPWISDGGPFDWWAPSGASGLSFKNGPGSVLDNIPTMPMAAGQADYFYPNDQSTRLMWYHDHAWGITRINAYAGVATGYLCLDPAQESAIADQTALNGLFGLTAPFDFKKPPVTSTLPDGTKIYGYVPSILSTIPIVFQEKKFVDAATIATNDPTWETALGRTDLSYTGALWYDHVYDPAKWRLLTGPEYKTPPDPSCVAEFFGDTMLVNGTCHPVATLEAKAYRFMFLNAINARFLNLNLLEVAPGAEITTPNLVPGTYSPGFPTNPPGPPIYQIGTEGGYLVKEVVHPNTRPADVVGFKGNLYIGCAERPDCVIDFTGCEGKEYILYNDLSGPYPGGDPINDFYAGNPDTPQAQVGTSPDTRQIMRFKIVPHVPGPYNPTEPRPFVGMMTLTRVPRNKEPFIIRYPAGYTGATPLPLPPAGTYKTKNLTLNENFDEWGRLRQLVGTTTIKPGSGGFGRLYLDPTTETSNLNDIEVWNIFNLTADTHPMHFHSVNVQILKRQPFRIVSGRFYAAGAARGPEPDEFGWKETCKMNPGEMIQVVMKIELPAVPFTVPASTRTGDNEFVWHCHILEHEEHDMMRPFVIVGDNPTRPIA
jgi:spore coat protein A